MNMAVKMVMTFDAGSGREVGGDKRPVLDGAVAGGELQQERQDVQANVSIGNMRPCLPPGFFRRVHANHSRDAGEVTPLRINRLARKRR